MVLYVPESGSARTLWISDGVAEEAELGRLETVGRGWLGAARDGGTARDLADGGTLLVAVRSAESETVGAIVAAKHAGRSWSRAERALASYVAEIYGPRLAGRATPAPAEALLLDAPWLTGSELESGMRVAISKGELSLAFQPEFDLMTSEVIAVEALLRWQHPTLGELGPDSFIMLAEGSDLIRIVGAWVIEESVHALAGWLEQVPGLDIELRVNISPAQMTGDELIVLFKNVLKETGVPGRRICVEITEHVPVTDLDEAARTLRRLKELGISSALDDLSSGYSTIGALRSLPVDVVKLDRTVVAGLHADPRAQAIVAAVVGLAAVLDVDVVAEGVEDEREVAALVRLGCTRAQGHYLGRPAPAAAVLELLHDRAHRIVEKR